MTVKFEDKLAEYMNRPIHSASTTTFVRTTGFFRFVGTTVSTSESPQKVTHSPNGTTRQTIEDARRGVNMVKCADEKDLFDRLND